MTNRIRLTIPRIESFTCPKDKTQAFLWDTTSPCLAVRATKQRKTFIFESRFDGKTVRMTLGDVASMVIEEARISANEKKRQIDSGTDPRLEMQRRIEGEYAKRRERIRQDATLGEAWPVYCEERLPSWSENYRLLHERLIHRGGEQRARSKRKTVPGPLAGLADLPLSHITPDVVKTWLAKEVANRPTQTRIAFEALSTFLNWCAHDHRYQGLASTGVCSARLKKDNLARKTSRDDCLQREQLKVWFDSVRRYENRVVSAYMQTLLLTGCRREEILSIKWSDVDFKWRRMSLVGKGGVPRDIPLTPYICSLLHALPRLNPWVFSSKRSKTGRLMSPTRALEKMAARAEIDGLTIHGLRRSFSTLAEWVEAPAGVIAQIQGHQPSAIAEKHYKKRPIDLLRVWHEKIEAWILEQAGIPVPTEQAEPLRLVVGGGR